MAETVIPPVRGEAAAPATPPDRYSTVAVWLHWGVAGFLLAMIGLGWYMVDVPRGTPERAYFYNLHKSIGVTAALLIAVRIWWRVTHKPPAFPRVMPAWQRRAAVATHGLLYACLVIMPASGFIASNFTKYGVKYFGIPLPILGWEDRAIYAVFNTIHVTTSWVLVGLIVLHVLAAVRHLFVQGRGAFRGMLPGGRA